MDNDEELQALMSEVLDQMKNLKEKTDDIQREIVKTSKAITDYKEQIKQHQKEDW